MDRCRICKFTDHRIIWGRKNDFGRCSKPVTPPSTRVGELVPTHSPFPSSINQTGTLQRFSWAVAGRLENSSFYMRSRYVALEMVAPKDFCELGLGYAGIVPLIFLILQLYGIQVILQLYGIKSNIKLYTKIQGFQSKVLPIKESMTVLRPSQIYNDNTHACNNGLYIGLCLWIIATPWIIYSWGVANAVLLDCVDSVRHTLEKSLCNLVNPLVSPLWK